VDIQRIVVGMDGSQSARDALRWAAALAAATGAEVSAVHAFVPMQSEKRPGFLERLRARQVESLAEWCGDILAGVPSTQEVVDGEPGDVLPDSMTRHHADLLVVASQGDSGGPGFLHVGSVVEGLAHHLDHPMAVITPAAAPAITRIVTGIDTSEHGIRAIDWSADIARATGASVIAVAVDDHPLAATDEVDWEDATDSMRAAGWAAPFADLGDRFTGVLSRARPVPDALLGHASTAAADLVVVGARDVGDVIGLRIGGTALAVLHRADRPVLIVPAA
jgi:nucleotide-binding universal stress UspA family protein